MRLGGDWRGSTHLWFFAGANTKVSGATRIAPTFAKRFSVPWRPTLTVFSATDRAALFGVGCGRSLVGRSRTTFGRKNRQPPAKATGGSDAYEHILAIPDGDASSVPEASDEETAIIVRKTLDLIRPEFEERTWQAFWRSAVEGQQSGVVAAALGMTPGGVRQAKSRSPASFKGGIGPTSRIRRLRLVGSSQRFELVP